MWCDVTKVAKGAFEYRIRGYHFQLSLHTFSVPGWAQGVAGPPARITPNLNLCVGML